MYDRDKGEIAMKRLVVCVLLFGCGGDDDGRGGYGTVELDNLGAELAAVSCSKQFECCTDAEIMELFDGLTYDGQPITTEEQCVAFANAFYTTFAVGAYKASLEKGRIEYDGAAAAECVAALERLSCSEIANGGGLSLAPVSCRPFIVPKVADDGACLQDYECISGNCMGESNSLGETPTDGTCRPIPMQGQECDDTCADGLYCDFDISANAETCQPLQPNGAECFYDSVCQSDYCDTTNDVCADPPVVCDGR